jgi:hypothetical protein
VSLILQAAKHFLLLGKLKKNRLMGSGRKFPGLFILKTPRKHKFIFKEYIFVAAKIRNQAHNVFL